MHPNIKKALAKGWKFQVERNERKRNIYNTLLPKHCRNCGRKLPYEKRYNTFCNQSCNASYHNKNRCKNMNKCAYCGEKTRNKKYCSNGCFTKHKIELIHKRCDELGVANPSNRSAKLYLISRRGHECEMCGTSVWPLHSDKPILLILDHINGNSEDWRISNLRLVCSNCDANLPTYKSKNNGNGRFLRRTRYMKNKSY